MRKHWAHTRNYEDFIEFAGIDLNDEVLCSYLKLVYSNKNTTYLSANTVSQCLKCLDSESNALYH